MKPEEVIRAIDLIREMDVNTPITQVDIANAEWGKEMAIEALEKQIPKKPKTDAHRILCPECNLLIAYNKSIEQHCWTCGQNLEGCVIK